MLYYGAQFGQIGHTGMHSMWATNSPNACQQAPHDEILFYQTKIDEATTLVELKTVVQGMLANNLHPISASSPRIYSMHYLNDILERVIKDPTLINQIYPTCITRTMGLREKFCRLTDTNVLI